MEIDADMPRVFPTSQPAFLSLVYRSASNAHDPVLSLAPAGRFPECSFILSELDLNNRIFWTLTTLFVAINAAILTFGTPCYLLSYTDACNHPCQFDCRAALGLLRHGSLVSFADPTQPFVIWPPGWGFVLYPFLWMSGGASVLGGVLINILSLYGLSLLARRVVEEEMPGYGMWAMAIVLFNPNAIGLSQLARGDTFFAFTIGVAFVALIYYGRNNRFRTALFVGGLLGLSLMLRANSQYLVLVLPIALVSISFFSRTTRWPYRQFGHGVAASLIAALIALPWLLYMSSNGQGMRLISYSKEHGYIADNIGAMEASRTGLRLFEVPRIGDFRASYEIREEAALRERIRNWDELSVVDQDRARVNYARRYFFSYPLVEYLAPVTYSVARFFLSGGEGYLNLIFNLEGELAGPDTLGSRVSLTATEIVAKGFAISMRILGLLGIVYLIRRRNYGLLLLILGTVSYFMATTLVSGWSRFRLPAEVPLLILATYGIAFVRRWRAGSGAVAATGTQVE